MSLRRPSVRTRLTLWHAGVLTVIVCAFSAGIFVFVRARLYRELDGQLDRQLATIERIAREEPGELSDLDPHWGVSLFQVVERGRVVHRTEAWESSGLGRAVANTDGTAPRSWVSADGRRYRVQAAAGPSHHIAVAIDESAVRHTLWTLAGILAMGIPCAAGLAIAGGYVLAGRVLVPVGAMAAQARKITAESIEERLPVANPDDEFGRLAGVFNDTLARLHDAFQRLRRFTADASHELRTPLTAMRSVGEVALQRALDPAGYRDVIGSMLEEVDRLTRLVESLLILTRAESGRSQPTRETVDVGELAVNVADHLRVLAEEKQQSLRVDVAAPMRIAADPQLLRQGLVNLVHNAIKYTPVRGAIDLRVGVGGAGECAVEVRDTGPGIAAVHRERIFERFYRVDRGRSRDAGGVGLGLAIARWAVEANGGRIELETDEGKGSCFRIVLPCCGRAD